MIAVTKVCLNCQQPLRGRSDKKFCNDFCRNNHHNQLNSNSTNYMRNINHCLRKNRRILESLLASSRNIGKASRRTLVHKGFDFHFFTHSHTNRKGDYYYFCYEYGYRLLEGEQVMVVKKQGILTIE